MRNLGGAVDIGDIRFGGVALRLLQSVVSIYKSLLLERWYLDTN